MSNKAIENLRGRLLAIELEVGLVCNDIRRLELERSYFEALADSRQDNIEVLKRDEIICTLRGYKKSKEELIYFREKLADIEIYIEEKSKIVHKLEESHNYYYDKFCEEWESYKNNEVILEFRRRT